MKTTQALLDNLTEQAQASPRLRANYDLCKLKKTWYSGLYLKKLYFCKLIEERLKWTTSRVM